MFTLQPTQEETRDEDNQDKAIEEKTAKTIQEVTIDEKQLV